ncbi:DNA-directed RNA polymerase I subunit 2 [Cucumis melo var. makuwa]|uniref:DNA-directed RNA polymerase n=1 Tax=Cucumis melo var. makuwa TaxID=1194695 RepID=A0A5A7VFY6_CUCMM|nr:DNA-directed RNA polymerase I subunit 2 [Cucumis melo var. makuwa]
MACVSWPSPLPPPKAKKPYTANSKRNKLQRELQNLQSSICYKKSLTLANRDGYEETKLEDTDSYIIKSIWRFTFIVGATLDAIDTRVVSLFYGVHLISLFLRLTDYRVTLYHFPIAMTWTNNRVSGWPEYGLMMKLKALKMFLRSWNNNQHRECPKLLGGLGIGNFHHQILPYWRGEFGDFYVSRMLCGVNSLWLSTIILLVFGRLLLEGHESPCGAPFSILLTLYFLELNIALPELYPPQKERNLRTIREALLPYECRQAKISYTGKFMADVCFQYDEKAVIREKFNFGQFPIMLKSKLCHLRGLDPKKLVSYNEEASEMGGYFVMNGLERVVRLLIAPKRNYPMSMVRNSFSDRREGYTDKAVVIRCVREDQSSVTVKLYYLRNGSARLGFWVQGKEYLLPIGVVLKALIDTNDHEIYASLTSCYSDKHGKSKGAVATQLVGERAKIILDEVRDLALFDRRQCLDHIGQHFQPVMEGLGKEKFSTVADAVLKNYIFVHLDNNYDKFNLLIFMAQKLFSLIDQTSVPDNPDSLQNQDVLLPGQLITLYLKEKLEDWLQKSKKLLEDEISNPSKNFEFCSLAHVKKVMDKNPSKQISSAVENMLKTGRLVTQTGLDLQQVRM